MKKILFFLYLILLPFINIAQNNRIYYYNGTISLNGNYVNINSGAQSILNASVLHNVTTKLKNDSEFDFTTNINYNNIIKNNSTILSNDIIFRINPRIIHKKWSIFNYEQVSSLYSRKIDLRIESAIGGGIYWLNTDLIQGTIAYSTIVSTTHYNNDIVINAIRHSPRVQLFFKYKNINSSIEMYYQPMISDNNNYNYNYTAKLSVPVNKSLSINLMDIMTYESFTIAGTSNSNSNLSLGITYHY